MEAPLSVFRQNLDLVRGELERFVRYHASVRYTYYHSEPIAPVPDEVWHFLGDNDEDDTPCERLDLAPDTASGLWWDEEASFDVENFRRTCNRCCPEIWSHAELFAPLAEIRDIVAADAGYHSWIRLVHRIVESNRVWLEVIDKSLVLSARPFEETRRERFNPYPAQPELFGPDEEEQQLVRELQRQNRPVPDVWCERIPLPHSVAQFHYDMLEVLYGRVETGYVVDVIGKLTTIQRHLIKSLGKKKLTTEKLVEELNRLTGSNYRVSGQIKTALTDLVKCWHVMENDGKGYKNSTPLGLQILAALS